MGSERREKRLKGTAPGLQRRGSGPPGWALVSWPGLWLCQVAREVAQRPEPRFFCSHFTFKDLFMPGVGLCLLEPHKPRANPGVFLSVLRWGMELRNEWEVREATQQVTRREPKKEEEGEESL